MLVGGQFEGCCESAGRREAMGAVAVAVGVADDRAAIVCCQAVSSAGIGGFHVAFGQAVIAEQDEVRFEAAKRLMRG